MAVKKKDELKNMLGSLSGGRNSLAAPTSQDTGGRSSLVSGASKVLSAAADKLKQQSGGANSPYTKKTTSTWRPNDTSGNDYAGMSGMSALHKAALEAAGRDYQTATTQQQRDAAHNQAEAIRALYNYSGGSDGSQYLPSAAAPTYEETTAPAYEDSYSARINSMIDDIINRKPFSYDAESDPLYQQYKASYTRQGEQAMQDTLGQMSARTGGLASSYAGSAAQQTYDNYMAAVADKIPELQQLAYNMYLQDLDSKRQDVALLQGQSNSDYSRFRDSMGDYQTNRSFGYGKYRDSMGDYKDDRSYRYQLDRDNISDKRYENEWNYNVGRDQISDQRYADETAYNRNQTESNTAYDRAMQLLSAGVMPDSTVLNRAGLTGSQANQMLAAAQAAVRSSGGSSGGRRSSGGGAGGGAMDYEGLFRAARESNHPQSFISNNYKKYGFTSATGLWPEYQNFDFDTLSNSDNQGNLSNNALKKLKTLETMRDQLNHKPDEDGNFPLENTIARYVRDGQLTDAEARYMFSHFGFDPDKWLE